MEGAQRCSVDKKVFKEEPNEAFTSLENSERTTESELNLSEFLYNVTATEECFETGSLNDDLAKSSIEPKTNILAADEFRIDSVLSPGPIAFHFFCCICGCPAGHDCFTCQNKGHPVCTNCQEELQIEGCPFVITAENGSRICAHKLFQFKSTFREFMFENTTVSCQYRTNGCKFQGLWDKVKNHQDTCQYAAAGK